MRHRIALVGRSLGLSSIGAVLEGKGEFELLRFNGAWEASDPWIRENAPDAVIFDMTVIERCPVIDTIRCPGLLLIGFDLSREEMVVVSGEQIRLSTTEDLLQVLLQHHLAVDETNVAGSRP